MNKNITFLHNKILCNSPCTLPIHMEATTVKVQSKYSIGVQLLDVIRIVIHGILLTASEYINS